MTEKHRKAEFEAITTMDEAKWKEASELAKKLKSVKISNYSMLDPDEFLAESFANEKLGVESNKYAKRVLDVIDKNFKR